MKKKQLLTLLNLLISLTLGILLILYIYSTLSESDKEAILTYFRQADYGWIAIAMVLALLSHSSRAWRWKYPLASMQLYPSTYNSFFAVMIGYLANLAIPRLGEASRCAVMARYEQMPFEKLFGTVIAERIADMLMLLLIMGVALILQFDNLYMLLNQDLSTSDFSSQGQMALQGETMMDALVAKLPSVWALVIAGLALLGLLTGFIVLIRNSRHPFILKVRLIFLGFWEGMKSIYSMERKWYFIFHTVFIWVMYIMMFYVAIFSLPGIKDIPFEAVLVTFVTASFAFIIIQGGLGAFPIMVMFTLAMYGVDKNEGLAFGWIIWTAQTALVILMGLISMLLMPVFNATKPLEAVEK